MSLHLDESLEAIEAAIHQARAALADEHEGNLRVAIKEIYVEASGAYDLVLHW